MNRLLSATLLSVGLHVGAFAVPSFDVPNRPDIDLFVGESRILMVYQNKAQEIKEESVKEVLKPIKDIEDAVIFEEVEVKEEKIVVEEKKEIIEIKQDDSVQSSASEGVVWHTPKFLKNNPPKYPKKALLRSIEGTVTLIANLNQDGTVDFLQLEESSGYKSLDKAALKAVKSWVFEPAMRNGYAVKSRCRIPVHFMINR